MSETFPAEFSDNLSFISAGMSSDEDHSVGVKGRPPDENTLEGILQLISSNKTKYERLMQEEQEMQAFIDDRCKLTAQFQERTVILTRDMEEEERAHQDRLTNQAVKVEQLKQEELDLKDKIRRVQAEISEEAAQSQHLKAQAQVMKAMPEKKFVFNGATAPPSDQQEFEMSARVSYPMAGGTALITFEEEAVAKKIVSMKTHRVELGEECRIKVESRPVHLLLPSLVEINSSVCARRILVSSLPDMEEETLKNKLEIHFSKSKHGGGEVEDCEYLADSRAVAVTFVKDDIARSLAETEFHSVTLDKKTIHRVRVTPFLNGEITNFKTESTVCPRTVLITGIPDVMEPENLQDTLEIHFQKRSNGGGEIIAFLYNPLGQSATALFSSTKPDAAAAAAAE